MLRAESLSFAFENGCGVKDITFALRNGEVCAVFGPQESGKSTIVKIAAGQLVPQSGDLDSTAGGGDCSRGFSDLDCTPPPRLPIYDWIVREVGRRGVSGAPRSARAMEALTVVGLQDHRSQVWNTLSSSRRAAAQIAFAICGRPSLAVIDGLFDALSPSHASLLFESIKDFARDNGLIILISSMDADLVGRADKIVLINQGQQLCVATPHELLTPSDQDVVTIEAINPGSVNATLRGRFQFVIEAEAGGTLTIRTSESHQIASHLMRHPVDGVNAIIVHNPDIWTVWNRLAANSVDSL